MARTFLILGGNLGNRNEYLEQARSLIRKEIGLICLQSSVYETEPWGFTDEKLFLNQVVEVFTKLDPFEVLAGIHSIENFMGRERGNARYAARNIDIDILLYNEMIVNTTELTIPHPEMIKRNFVLQPLAEIAPEVIHPVANKTIGELLAECRDTGKVRKVPA
jgi:2-amino-4-hydroxy-6-hydroxymethyldihydropteridine diphosphokinase